MQTENIIAAVEIRQIFRVRVCERGKNLYSIKSAALFQK